MKVAILGDANSSHVLKWVTYLSEKDITIVLISLSSAANKLYYPTNVKLYCFNYGKEIFQKDSNSLSKIQYLRKINQIKRIIRKENIDILHAHYASSYGLIGALTNFHPFIVSFWGSDIFNFPRINWLNKYLIKFILNKSDKVLSTSKFMAEEIKRYTTKKIDITPFGVDLNKFKYNIKESDNNKYLTIGCVKFLEKNYGIDFLIKAFKILKDELKDIKFKLIIVGSGSQEIELKTLVQNLKLGDSVSFIGKVDPMDIPAYHQMLDIAVYPSIQESFGVSIIESSACSIPVVASNIGGFSEVVKNGITGLLIDPQDVDSLASTLKDLTIDAKKRILLGTEGRKFVELHYDLDKNVAQMISIYKSVIYK